MSDESLLPSEQNFRDELKRRRRERGIGQADLLERLHAAGLTYLNQTALSRIESGSRQVRLVEAQAIAQILGRSLESMTQPSPVLAEAEKLLHYTEQAELNLLDVQDYVEEVAKHALRISELQGDDILHGQTDAADSVRAAMERANRLLDAYRDLAGKKGQDYIRTLRKRYS